MELKEVLLRRRSVRRFTEEAVSKLQELLSMPKEHIPLNIIFIGHPAEIPEARDQYHEEYVHRVG